ncbi:MAG: hypothetical protein AAF481_02390 [Acidobacteriota bacterium]
MRFLHFLWSVSLLVSVVLPVSGQLSTVGGEIEVSRELGGIVQGPGAAGSGAGEVSVIWTGECDVPGLCGRIFGADGVAQGPESPRAVSTGAFPSPPATALLPGGEMLVVWSRLDASFTGDVVSRRFDGAGNPLGPETLVAAQVGRLLGSPDVVALPAGGFAVVWENLRFEGEIDEIPQYSGVAIEGRLLNVSGAPAGAVFRVDDPAPDLVSGPRISATGDGDLVVVWESFEFDLEGDDVLARWLSPVGAPLGPEFVVPLQNADIQDTPRVAAAPGGGALVVWESRAEAGTGPGIYARLIEPAGPLGVSETRLSGGGPAQRSRPSVTAVSGGRFVAAWEEVSVLNGRILARLVNEQGFAAGPEVEVNASPGVDHRRPSVAAGAGGVLVTWQRRSQEFTRRVLARRLALPFVEEPCEAGPETLCLGADGRFRVEVDWRNQRNGDSGTGKTIERSEESGFFWFFNAANVELVVKIIDGRAANGHFWVFYGALSDVEYTIAVTDTATGEKRFYSNEAGNLCGRGDTTAFPLGSAGRSELLRVAVAPEPGGLTFPMPSAASSDAQPLGACGEGDANLCLLDERFRVEVDWRNQRNGDEGVGTAIPFSDESGFFWFFNAANVELVVKMIDGRPVTGRFWVFYGALSDVEYRITVTDMETGATAEYLNPPGNICGRGDTEAL